MPESLVVIGGMVVLTLAALGLFTGKVMAGSRGLQASCYHRRDAPFLYYGVVFVYLSFGVFLVYQGLQR